jgi:hypothetical protein
VIRQVVCQIRQHHAAGREPQIAPSDAGKSPQQDDEFTLQAKKRGVKGNALIDRGSAPCQHSTGNLPQMTCHQRFATGDLPQMTRRRRPLVTGVE